MSPLRLKIFALASLASLAAIPLAQWWGDQAAGQPWTGRRLFERLPTAAHLRAVEQEQQSAAARNPYLRLLGEAPGLQWLRAADSPVMQARGAGSPSESAWLFYRPDVRLVSQRPSPDAAERAAAATIHWRDQLATRGIRLIVVVAPTKALVHPPASLAVEAVWKSPELQTYQAALQAGQVEYVDLHAAFAGAPPEVRRKAPLYLPTDTHWSRHGLDLASATIAGRISGPRRTDAYVVRELAVPHVGDLERWRAPAIPPGPQTVAQITDAQGKAVSPRPGEAEVLLIGDSFCRIFEEGSVVGAGLRSQLAWRLGRPVAMVQRDGGGATLVRQELARRPEWLRGVKVVVWEFAERDLTSPDAEWSPVELPR